MRRKNWGIEFEVDLRHRQVLADFFGFQAESAAAARNGDKERKVDEPGEEEEEERGRADA